MKDCGALTGVRHDAVEQTCPSPLSGLDWQRAAGVTDAGKVDATGSAATRYLAVDLRQAGQMCGVSGKTLRREIARGNLHALRIGRQWRVRVAELNEYLKRLEKKNSPVVGEARRR